MSSSQNIAQLPPHMVALGRTVVLQLHATIKTLRGHGANNAAFLAALEKLVKSINAVLPHGGNRLELRFYEDILMLNGAILRVSATTASQFDALSRILRERRVGGLAFHRPVDGDLLRHWMLRFDQPLTQEGGLDRVRRSLDELLAFGIETFDPKIMSRHDMDVVKVSSLSYALQAYARAIVGFREFVTALEQGRDPFLGKLNLVRVVQDLVDIASSAPGLLLKVMHIRDEHRLIFRSAAGGYPARHAASTCVWSLLVGVMMQLDRYQLLDLGTSALLSKVGFALLPEAMTEKRGELTQEERRELRLSTVRAVQALIAKSRLSDIMMRRVVVAYEHQRPYAHPTGEPTNIHVYSRVVAIADAFDAMLSERPWRDAMPAHVAMDNLKRQAGERFDPVLVALLDTAVAQA